MNASAISSWMKRTLSRGATVAIVTIPSIANADAFLWFPLDREYPITCGWTCTWPSGQAYNHQATDYRVPMNQDILAGAEGEVIHARADLNPRERVRELPYGNEVRIRHLNGYVTIYAHLFTDSILVNEGEQVEAGQIIARSDHTGHSTGPHLHFEVRDPSGQRVNPYGDPPDYFGGCGPNALWATCPPERYPECAPDRTESCNGRDDNCDGQTDEDWPLLGQACTVGQGACQRGAVWACEPGGRGIVCDVDAGRSEPETCNGVDDDCDGVIDNGTDLCAEEGGTCTNGACLACDPPGPECGAQGNCPSSIYATSRELVVDMWNHSPGQCSQQTFTYVEINYHVPAWAQCNGDQVRWREYLTRNAFRQQVSATMTFDAYISASGILCGSARGEAAFQSGYCTDIVATVYQNGYTCD